MRNEGIGILVIGMAFATTLLAARKKVRQTSASRLDAIRDAMRNPALSDAAKADLVQLLAREELAACAARRPALPGTMGIVYRLWFAACWCAFTGGSLLIGLWVIGFAPTLNREFVGVTTAGAFALLTLPLAWHELRRRTAATAKRPAPSPAVSPQ